MEMLCLLKTYRDLQILFAAVTHLGTLLMLKVEKTDLLNGYTETNSAHKSKTVNFVLANVNEK
jgi:hypothetical protein